MARNPAPEEVELQKWIDAQNNRGPCAIRRCPLVQEPGERLCREHMKAFAAGRSAG